jgi:hypothetical protein
MHSWNDFYSLKLLLQLYTATKRMSILLSFSVNQLSFSVNQLSIHQSVIDCTMMYVIRKMFIQILCWISVCTDYWGPSVRHCHVDRRLMESFIRFDTNSYQIQSVVSAISVGLFVTCGWCQILYANLNLWPNPFLTAFSMALQFLTVCIDK